MIILILQKILVNTQVSTVENIQIFEFRRKQMNELYDIAHKDHQSSHYYENANNSSRGIFLVRL